MNDLHKAVGELSPEQLARLRSRLAAERLGTERISTIPRRGATGTAPPLSFGQERLWFFEQFRPGSAVYVLSGQVRWNVPVDHAVLERSIDEIVRRHEALRTTFAPVSGHLAQIVAPSAHVALPTIDLRGVTKTEQDAALRSLAAEEARRPFDLARGPLLRATSIMLGDADVVLQLSMHHIVSDGWSIGVFFRELGALYAAFAAGKPSPLPELPLQYVDFALWQRESLQGDVLARHLSFWRNELAGAPSFLALPIDRPRPALQTFDGASAAFEVPPDVARELKELGRREGATPFMVLLAAFATLLARYTGQDDVVIGAPIANRTRAELESLIGFFVNTLALRVDLAGDPPFRELLHRVREVTLNAYAHQDLPFEKLVRELQPERSLSHNPLFQVVFAAQNAPAQGGAAPVAEGTAKVDLGVFALEDDDAGLRLVVEYNTGLFDAATIARMVGHLNALLAGIVADPDRRLCDLPLSSAAEARALVAWNATEVPYARDRCVHELLEEQSARTPGALAVRAADEQLTYRELHACANRLAHRLRELGVAPEVRVGACIDRSALSIVTLLAILKAGGVYVPLAPSDPPDRRAFVLADAHVAVLLTRESLDAEAPLIALQPDTNPPRIGTPDHLAYLIYTSGSTGVPKGVMVAHRGLSNLVRAQAETFGLGADDRVLQLASPSFDAAIFEVLLALSAGATLEIAGPEALRPGPPLSALLRERGVTALIATPSVLSTIAADALDDLHTVVSAGERCTPDVVERWSRVRLYNGYGPTETSICATITRLEPGMPPATIGRPIGNVHLYVADRTLAPLPVGVVGELYIGGAGCARGYLGRADLTAERFLPDPFTSEPGARMYRSGDLARRRADGTVEFVGRADRQVKVRGNRVELGEVESALRRHAAVREAVVVVREDTAGRAALAAYVTCADRSGPSVTELRAFLGASLPEYMIPASFTLLDALPIAASGKVDLAGLPGADGERPALEQSFVAPRTPREMALARIWSDVLGIERIGVHDNFFELGGHSLLAATVTAKIEAELGVDLSLRAFFTEPTIAALARHAETEAAPTASGRSPSSNGAARAAGDRSIKAFADEHKRSRERELDVLGAVQQLSDDQVVEALAKLGIAGGETASIAPPPRPPHAGHGPTASAAVHANVALLVERLDAARAGPRELFAVANGLYLLALVRVLDACASEGER